MIDILDKLQAINGFVQLVLTSGEIVLGKPDCIVYDEDEEGYDTIKTIRFEPWGKEHARYFREEEIKTYDDFADGGLYCIAPDEKDLAAFAEHARKCREAYEEP